MSRKEVPRAGLVKAALAGRITTHQGATALRLRVRQFQRLKRRFREGGAPALLHRARGQPSRRRLPAQVRQQVAALMRTTYAGFNDVHLTEKLQELHRLPVSRASVRRIRRVLGLPAKHRRRPRQYRARRTPEAQMGALVQLDGSPCDWLEGRGPAMTLLGAIDDATATVLTFDLGALPPGISSPPSAPPPPGRAPAASACEPYRELIETALARGRDAIVTGNAKIPTCSH